MDKRRDAEEAEGIRVGHALVHDARSLFSTARVDHVAAANQLISGFGD
jgi:hypothetical protein